MEKKKIIPARILILALVNLFVCFSCFILLKYLWPFNIEWTYLFLSAFACFITGFLVLYYFYYVDVSKNMNILAEKIKKRFANNEIPQKYSQLEEEDALDRLEERVDFLIESREKEVIHFENLDSYRKEYLGNVSHELKTPVFNIQGYVDTLLNGGLEDPNINHEYLRRAEKSIDRLINIIDDLETITQLESGALVLDIDTFDIAWLCKDIYASLELNAAKKNMRNADSVRPVPVIFDTRASVAR